MAGLLDSIKAEIDKVKDDLEARITDVIRVAKVGEAALAADVKVALANGKAEALKVVEAEDPAAAALMSQVLDAIEQEILAVLAQHVLG